MGLWKLWCIQWIPCHREIQSGLNEQRIVIKSAVSGCLGGPFVAATCSRSSALVFTRERGRGWGVLYEICPMSHPAVEPSLKNWAKQCSNRIVFSPGSSHSLLRLIWFNKTLQTDGVTVCCLYSLEVNSSPIKHQGVMENSCMELKIEIVAEKLEASSYLCKGAPQCSRWTAQLRAICLCVGREVCWGNTWCGPLWRSWHFYTAGFWWSAGFPVHSPSICCCTQRTGSSLGWHRISLCFPFSASSCLLPKHRSLRHIISAAVVSTIQHTSRPAAASGWWPMQNTSQGVTHISSPSYCLHCGAGY